MITVQTNGAIYKGGSLLPAGGESAADISSKARAREKTISYKLLSSHNTSGSMDNLKLRFDALASHDITYVGIIQTARASGLTEFPLPYVLTNCHNSLCAVGGTINEDDHLFGLSAAKKYGGEFVPAHLAVIHTYMRENYAKSGGMILASDSHTRYGPVGSMSIGEGGPELVKQLLGRTYDIKYPEITAVYLSGKPRPGVGPQDVAISLIGAVFGDGLVKNKVLEFVGPGVKNLSMDFRFGIDVMTTETTCLSSVWQTDGTVREYLTCHGRPGDFAALEPEDGAYYDSAVYIDLDKAEPMIALPFHPSNAYTIREFKENMTDILAATDAETARLLKLSAPGGSLLSKVRGGRFMTDQAFVGGCSGGLYQNIMHMTDILDGGSIDSGAFSLSVYPASQPMMLKLTENGSLSKLMQAGAVIRSAFCGPCFGAGDTPANGAFSIRHSTRNFPNREGSKPSDGQISYVALMDARSIAATAVNGGALTSAFELDSPPANEVTTDYTHNPSPYKRRVYFGVGEPKPEEPLVFGPNIADWPEQLPLPENLLIEVASAIYDPVTTTDELIPSGETSSYRSNPMKLASFTLSRKDPGYVGRTQAVGRLETERRAAVLSGAAPSAALSEYLGELEMESWGIGSAVFALKPGDGSAREQAASCQRVLGGVANIAGDYATKRYRSNVVNWGMLPFTLKNADSFGIKAGDRVYVRGIRAALLENKTSVPAVLSRDGKETAITLDLPAMSRDETDVILAGCLINYYNTKD
ncbi:MAG: hydratase [Oscillospiraceae bacterium]|nr:hydratase [Oscillospiraceae bacterium]